ncbi:monovalent cation/H(+) antiporter subunit G [Clostridium grantii]|uniref:Multisubunit sodium/proton antiporter, MrpG subunit n=1 Tax=Clostridium grantii DSM 8605 TaxID=1121316 RepID=A0A1M5UIU2_9CLOT|nr:monovalent cation/H(+) antiporter subunit G [Clostridium grantii]SHH62899.1 multisubunit sodium/proton antiporter, MrpG subunit [Clostridium grantii DSM 8605]
MRVIIATIFLFGGLFFFMVGTIGILRFKDVFTRAHSAAKCDTLGAMLSLTSLIIYNGINWVSLKIILIIIFIWITNPTATHIITKGAYGKGKVIREKEVKDNANI